MGRNWAVDLVGLVKSGVGLGQSVPAIPGVTVEIIQELWASTGPAAPPEPVDTTPVKASDADDQ